jgi:hypothetical protein
MKTELQQKLLKKYAQFFPTGRKIYTGEKDVLTETQELLNQKEIVLPIQFGFECEDGWYMILDNLMSEIANHIENVNRNNENAFKYKWMQNLSYKLKYRIRGRFKKILNSIGEYIYENAPRGVGQPVNFQIDQIKEKFSGLRFYYSGGDDCIEGMVSLAETLSYHICEDCGSTLNIGYTKGWITTMCKDCYDKHPRKDTIKWEPLIEE